MQNTAGAEEEEPFEEAVIPHMSDRCCQAERRERANARRPPDDEQTDGDDDDAAGATAAVTAAGEPDRAQAGSQTSPRANPAAAAG